jgi:hypothetical protein
MLHALTIALFKSYHFLFLGVQFSRFFLVIFLFLKVSFLSYSPLPFHCYFSVFACASVESFFVIQLYPTLLCVRMRVGKINIFQHSSVSASVESFLFLYCNFASAEFSFPVFTSLSTNLFYKARKQVCFGVRVGFVFFSANFR